MGAALQNRQGFRLFRVARLAALPGLAAVFPILSFYSDNASVVAPTRVIFPTLLAAAGGLLVFALFLGLCRSPSKGALVGTAFVVLFYMYRVFIPAAHSAEVGSETQLLVGAGLFFLLAAFVTAFAVYARSTKRSFDLAADVLFIVAAFTCVMPVASVLSQGVLFASAMPTRVSAQPAGETEPDVNPDIYYVILDGYSRSDVLSRIYNVDNTAFLGELERRGFFIAKQSRSNYLQTLPSLASSMNGAYLDELAAVQGSSSNRLPLTEMVKNNWAMKYLRDHGYALVNIESGFECTSPNPNVDVEMDLGYTVLGEFEAHLVRMTPLDEFNGGRQSDLLTVERNRVLRQFEALAKVPELGKPRFVMCHIVSPHPPFVFDEAGQVPAKSDPSNSRDASHFRGTSEEYQRGYGGQVKFLNRRLLEVIDSILADADPGNPPVIIVQGDHGGGSLYDQEHEENSLLWERASILNAYLAPRSVTSRLYPSITPVNSFRILFNGLFGAQLEQLPDRTFYSTWSTPYVFAELSEDQLSPTRPLTDANRPLGHSGYASDFRLRSAE